MKLSIEGYKSIADKCTIEFNGLTVLAGANSSGKSSFMQPLLLIKCYVPRLTHVDFE
jgi:predicted ATPase